MSGAELSARADFCDQAGLPKMGEDPVLSLAL
jgi:hypothetical protein